ncbi:hypothetical protein KL86DPRO_20203 [uncultured delta proteobacterium]|uniref:BioF2-like acetyltransferase domain-containing protein n=1 Tax=uncultured delta proteobacterium TaxID=34034 RepID=A0A212JWE0_9DELT|nr:hypothetical protein KL86DPRO_20203 [uncultured delta proteobacterium]
MQVASFDIYAREYEALKRQSRRYISNIFFDAPALQTLMAEKPCLFFVAEHCFFLLVPYHGKYYDCLYMATEYASLEQGLAALLAGWDIPMPIRASVIGKEPIAGTVADIFSQHGLVLVKKLVRTEIQTCSDQMSEALNDLAAENVRSVSFAEESDADAVLALLLEYFDLYADNIPERSRILEAIRNRYVVVIKIEGEIAALHYFEMKNRLRHGLFDLTIKKHRQKFLFFALYKFLDEYFKQQEIEITRSFGWKDQTKKKLMRLSKKQNQYFDGVVFYQMLRQCDANTVNRADKK